MVNWLDAFRSVATAVSVGEGDAVGSVVAGMGVVMDVGTAVDVLFGVAVAMVCSRELAVASGVAVMLTTGGCGCEQPTKAKRMASQAKQVG